MKVGVKDDTLGRSVLASCIGHAVAFSLAFYLAAPKIPELGESIVYSISLEGGKTLGGMSQVPANDKKEAIAPPKKVSEPQAKVPEKTTKEVKAEVKEETKPVEIDKDTVSLAEKKKEEEVKKKEEEKKKKEEEQTKAKEKAEQEKQKKKEEDKKKQEDEQRKAKELERQYQQALQRYTGESTEAGGQGFGAAKLGGSGMGGGVQRPPEFFVYRDQIRTAVKEGWKWYDTASSLRATVIFRISQRGEISDVTIEKSSGNREFDTSLLRAIAKASPLPPPPEIVYEYFKVVRIEFDPTE